MNKSKHRSHIVLKIITVLFAIYSIFNIISLRSSIKEKQIALNNIERMIYEQQIENQRLEGTIGGELTDEEIAEIAMEKLGYAFPGEIIFKNVSGK